MRSFEGKTVSCSNQRSSRHLLSLGIQDNNSGERQPNLVLDVQTLLRTIPKRALTVCACIQRTVPCMKEPAVFPDSTQVLCSCSHGFLCPQACCFFFSELFCAKKAQLLAVLPTALLVIVTKTRSNPTVISSKHLLPAVHFSFLLEYFGLTEP